MKKILDVTQPHVDYAWKQYLTAHDTVAVSCTLCWDAYCNVFNRSSLA